MKTSTVNVATTNEPDISINPTSPSDSDHESDFDLHEKISFLTALATDPKSLRGPKAKAETEDQGKKNAKKTAVKKGSKESQNDAPRAVTGTMIYPLPSSVEAAAFGPFDSLLTPPRSTSAMPSSVSDGVAHSLRRQPAMPATSSSTAASRTLPKQRSSDAGADPPRVGQTLRPCGPLAGTALLPRPEHRVDWSGSQVSRQGRDEPQLSLAFGSSLRAPRSEAAQLDEDDTTQVEDEERRRRIREGKQAAR